MISLMACDVGPCQSFMAIQQELSQRGIPVMSRFGHGVDAIQATESSMQDFLQGSTVALFGMSSNAARAEIEFTYAAKALDMGIPVFLFADIYLGYKRFSFKDLFPRIAGLFVIDHEEGAEALSLYPSLRVLPYGNPAWQQFINPPLTASPKEGVCTVLGVGTKNIVVDALLWSTLISAAMICKIPVEVCLAPHPGGKYPGEFLQALKQTAGCPVRLREPDETTSGLLQAANVVVSSYSTIGIEAVCQNKGVIDFMTSVAVNKWLALTGTTVWQPLERGLSLVNSGDVNQLADQIQTLYRGLPPHMQVAREKLMGSIQNSAAKIADVLLFV